MRLLKQSTARNVMLFMTDSADHVSGKTGLTPTITASKDGAAFASIAPTVTERGSGWYSVSLTTAHTDTLGDFVLHVTATGADPTDLACQVVAGSLDADVSTRLATSGYTAPPSVSAIRSEIDTNSTKLDVAVSTRLGTSGYTAPPSVSAIRSEIDTNSTKLDVAVSTRLGTSGYTAPPSAAAIRSEIDANSTKLDVAVSTRLGTSGYTAPDNAGIATASAAAASAATDASTAATNSTAIKAKTDQLAFTVAGQVDANTRSMNSAAVLGAGNSGDKWRGA